MRKSAAQQSLTADLVSALTKKPCNWLSPGTFQLFILLQHLVTLFAEISTAS